jgi:uncharacterized protein (DUF58 family)
MPLPVRFLVRLRRLPLRLRARLGGGAEGQHPSTFRGAGLSFVENRPYQPGDDPRHIHWPLTARAGHPILKRFESSRDLVLWLVVDPSPTMFLGDPVSPLRWAFELCGAAFATLQASGDRLGLVVPGDGRTPALRIAPGRGRVHGLRILEALADRGPCVPTEAAWREALGHWGEHARGHRLWLFSDGAGLGGLAPHLGALATRHRVVWFQPTSQEPSPWPDPGFPASVTRLAWDPLEDPVPKLDAWLRAGGA